MSNHKYQSIYLRRAERVALLLAGLPFVEFVGLTGSVARGVATPQSDIDIFIVSRPGRLYTTRWFVTALVQMLGLRRHGPKIAGRLCLNRYHTRDDLEIRPHSRYHAIDLSKMMPLVDLAAVYPAYRAANEWMETEHGQKMSALPQRSSRSVYLSRYPKRVGEWLLSGWLGNQFERFVRTLQLAFAQKNPSTKQLRMNVVFSDTQLLFHPKGAPDE